jgi:hypothetical protein
MQRGGVKASRDHSLCSQNLSREVTDWVGTVTTIDSNSDGKGVLAVQIAPDITIKTWNNALSDIESDTLIEPESPVFQSASAMKPGELVRFSGIFLPGDSGDCVKEASLTLQGKVERPDFIFRFSNISRHAAAQVNDIVSTPVTETNKPISTSDPQPTGDASNVRGPKWDSNCREGGCLMQTDILRGPEGGAEPPTVGDFRDYVSIGVGALNHAPPMFINFHVDPRAQKDHGIQIAFIQRLQPLLTSGEWALPMNECDKNSCVATFPNGIVKNDEGGPDLNLMHEFLQDEGLVLIYVRDGETYQTLISLKSFQREHQRLVEANLLAP